MEWGLFWQILIGLFVATVCIVLVMSFYQTGQENASKRRVQEIDAKARLEREHMQSVESEIRLMNINGGKRP
jgi:hypothetical protein